ncbi:MAG: HAD-IIB family hydrolase [Chitinivibrionales bacterium]|nr:HAD-IIB family hydrolase [Chitinivibrionales bacterium]
MYSVVNKFLLACDIDGTLLDTVSETTDQKISGVNRSKCLPEEVFRQFVIQNRDRMTVAYCTGRSIQSVIRLIERERLAEPTYICSSVGTQLYQYRDEEVLACNDFQSTVYPAWNVHELDRLCEGQGIVPQQLRDGRTNYHAGFTWDGRQENLTALLERIASLYWCQCIVSHGCYIDIIPLQLGKAAAVRFIVSREKIPGDRIVVAGDSGNDRSLFESNYFGIIPSNAYAELIECMKPERHYLSGKPSALGVLDGLLHFGFVTQYDD